MLPGNYNTGLQAGMDYYESVCDNLEEYGQKHGSVVVIPTWGDRLTLMVGRLLITIGQKMTASSLKNMQLSKDLT